jgi:hypothetical protein
VPTAGATAENDRLPPEQQPPLTAEDLQRDYPELVEEICREAFGENRRLQAEVERLTGLAAEQEKRETVRRLLREFKLPDAESCDPKDKAIVSKQFLQLLMEAEGIETMRALVEERAQLARSSALGRMPAKPCSRDQNLVVGLTELDAKSFAEAIT